MRRREFIGIAGGAVAWPLAARAQQKPMPVIGFLSPGSRDSYFDFESFRQGLLETGYVHGHNLAIEYRWAENQVDRLPGLAAELAARNVDLIFSVGGVPGARAAKEASATIPIVFIVGVDPVARGLVDSLGHPGGNLTGLTVFGPELNQKRLELLSELAPTARIFGMLVNQTNPTAPLTSESVPQKEQEVARARGLDFRIIRASTVSEIDAAFKAMAEWHLEALLLTSR
jgi:putative ABC transport system substrate-binding protein